MIVAAFAAGAAWGLIPATLKAFLGVNEIITTLMLNYVAILWIQYLYYGPWKDPKGFGFPGTEPFPDAAILPRLKDTPLIAQFFDTGRAHYGLLLAILAAVRDLAHAGSDPLGLRDQGNWRKSRAAARYAGISMVRNILLVMILSGGLAGLAGFSQVSGVAHRLQQGIVIGDGYTAIIIAWLARLNPFGVLLVAILMAALFVGGDQIQITMGLPAAVALVLQGAILFFVLGGNFFTKYRMIWVAPEAQAKVEA